MKCNICLCQESRDYSTSLQLVKRSTSEDIVLIIVELVAFIPSFSRRGSSVFLKFLGQSLICLWCVLSSKEAVNGREGFFDASIVTTYYVWRTGDHC